MDETTKLLREIKEELARKDETYRLIADSKPGIDCQCRTCSIARMNIELARPTSRTLDSFMDEYEAAISLSDDDGGGENVAITARKERLQH